MKENIIALDVMGCDKGALATVKGAVDSLSNPSIKIILVGTKEDIETELKKYKYDETRIEIVPTTEVIENTDTPTKAIKTKKDSSMVVGLNLVKEGRAGAFISGGNTGALLTGATTIIGRIKGVERPALATLLPNIKNHTVLIDSGANTDCKASYLQQFAILGSLYAKDMLNIETPTVGLVNIGSEKGKGNELTKEAYNLLEETNVNFIGNIEAREIPAGVVDVLVCDAFVGNVVLKLSEGTTESMMKLIKTELTSSLVTKIGAGLSKSAFLNIKNKFDYREVGGAPFLGLKGLVLKAHGSSDDVAIKNAINQGYMFLSKGTLNKFEESINELNNEKSNS